MSNVVVNVNKNDSIEKALRKFKKLCNQAGIKKELKNRRYYVKPSEKKRLEAKKFRKPKQKQKQKHRNKSLKHLIADIKR